jgi:hypothetical protein
VDQVADLELRRAEDFRLGLADQQAGQLHDVVIDRGAAARGQGQGLLFLLGGQDGGRHGYLVPGVCSRGTPLPA